MNHKQQLIILSGMLLLNACGGGSSSEPATSTPITTTPEPTPTTPSVQIEHLSGGETSVDRVLSDAFSKHVENLENDLVLTFNIGNDFFQNPWVEGSSGTSSRDGLGGLFNNNACQDCHIDDGRGHAPADENDNDFASILFRTAKEDISAEDKDLILQSLKANVPDRYFGGQLQQDAISGVTPEVQLQVSYTTKPVQFNDGTIINLREPSWTITSNIAGKNFEDDVVFSARVAPPMIGLGLLELILEADITNQEDVNDSDGDGISGKANYVWSIAEQAVALGRFGWKAGQPSLLEQSAGAFVNDMGLTSRLHQTETCTEQQIECLNAPNGNGDNTANGDYDYEVSDTVLDNVTFYSGNLSVPQRRNAYSEQVQQGKALFMQAGCQACHTESYTTMRNLDQVALSEQVIFPYTDMLLHDMGPDLADFTQHNEPASADMLYEFLATATEWRTPPLWGLGLTKTVDENATFLHDGRARTIMEAVLWHGGEAENAKQQVLTFNQSERDALLAFLNDL